MNISNYIKTKGGYWTSIALIMVFSYYILKNANWVWGDDVIFITGSAIGQNNWIPMGAGRFFPLNFQEFNLLKYIPGGNLPVSHYIISAAIFIGAMILILRFMCEVLNTYFPTISYKSWVGFFSILMLAFAPDVIWMYQDIIFPERNVILCYALFMLLYFKGIETNKLSYYCWAGLVAVISFFYKEPVFGTYIVIALVPFIFNYRQVGKGHKLFSVIIGLGVLGYLLSYYFLVYVKSTSFYNSGRVFLSFDEFLLSIFNAHKFFMLLILLGLYRAYKIIIQRETKYLFMDSLLFAGLAYFVAFILLNLNARYYFTPVYVLTIPSLCLCLISVWQKQKYMFWGLVIILGYICINNYRTVQINVMENQYHRQEDMKMINYLAQAVENGKELLWYQEINKKPENSFSNLSVTDRKNKLNKFISYVLQQNNIYTKEVDTVRPIHKNEIFISVPENRLEKEIDYSVLGSNIKRTDALWLEVYEPIDFPKIKLPAEICFGADCAIDEISFTGVSVQEAWGVWSDGRIVTLTFRAPKSNNDLRVTLNVQPFLSETYTTNKGKIKVNNHTLTSWKFKFGETIAPIEFTIPHKYINEQGMVTLQFKIKDPKSPKELGISADVRELGLGFVSMKISEM